MRSTFRNALVGFLLVFGGIMAANLASDVLTPETRLMYPVWVVLGLVPAYWFGWRIGAVSLTLWEVLGVVGMVLVAIVAMELWRRVRPLSALALAALVCVLFLARRRWLAGTRTSRR